MRSTTNITLRRASKRHRNLMGLETATTIYQLDANNPSGTDLLQTGDDHIRLIKAALKATFPGIKGPLSSAVTHDFLNSLAVSTIPLGAIMLWTGSDSSVPAGWAICDGRTVAKTAGGGNVTTPDLRGRVPVAVSSDHAVGATFGQTSKQVTSDTAGKHTHGAAAGTAGAHSHGGTAGDHTLTIDETPAHRHLVASANNGSPVLLQANNAVISLANQGGDSAYGLAGSTQDPNIGQTSSVGGGHAHSHSISSDGGHTHQLNLDQAGDHSHPVTVDVTQPSIAVYFIMRV